MNSVKARTPILALILFVFAVSYTVAATNKVVVIPMGADTDVAPLIERIQALEAKLACVDDFSDRGNFFLLGCNVTIDAGTGNVSLATETVSLLLAPDTGDLSATTKRGTLRLKASSGNIIAEATRKTELKVGGSSIKIEPEKVAVQSAEANIEGRATAEFRAPLVNVDGTSLLNLKGALIQGGGLPVARQGDPVTVSVAITPSGAFVGTGVITSGNPSVLF